MKLISPRLSQIILLCLGFNSISPRRQNRGKESASQICYWLTQQFWPKSNLNSFRITNILRKQWGKYMLCIQCSTSLFRLGTTTIHTSSRARNQLKSASTCSTRQFLTTERCYFLILYHWSRFSAFYFFVPNKSALFGTGNQ